ncbi:MAG: ABC transporter substrate-binding protein [Eubacterium sp.]|nr:ABC transporter substrate-binding protein [Eubacterium sp.]
MISLRKIIGTALVSMFAVGLLTGCGGTASSQSSVNESGKVVLKVGSLGEPNSLDPKDFNYYQEIGYDFYSRLLKFTQDGSDVEPDLAESWEQVDDTTYTYKIREGVKFSDGKELTMDDVLYSMERVTKNEYSMSYLFANVKKFSIDKDKWILKVKLKRPDSTWKYVPATSPCTIVQKEICEKEGDKYGSHEGSVVGTGPYKYVSWTAGSEIIYEKNPDWFGGADKVDVDRVEYYIMADSSTIALACKSGTIDMGCRLQNSEFSIIDNLSNFQFTTVNGTNTEFLSLNTEIEPFNDVNARKALAYCIDSQAITEQIGGRYAKKLPTVSISSSMKYMDEAKWDNLFASLEDYTVQDYDKAKEYLAKSKYPKGFKFDCYATPTMVNEMEVIQSMCAKAGITMNIVKILESDGFTYSYGYNADKDGHRPYQALAGGWISDYVDPVGQLKTVFHSSATATGGANKAMWKNSKFDKLLDKSYLTTDDSKRLEYFLEATKIASEECPYIDLYEKDTIYGLNKNFEFKPSPQDFWNFSYANVKYVGKK